MGLRIATNTQSLAAQRNLGVSSEGQKASIDKLASGTRIRRAADDAAGLSISEVMKAQIRSLGQANRNAHDGIAMIQTAEGGMNEVANILIRFRELSIQAASDTIGDNERGFINKEVVQLSNEIDRIAASTEFNGKKLLTGEGEPMEIQIGLHNDKYTDRIAYDPVHSGISTHSLGLEGISTATKESARENLDRVDGAINVISEHRAVLGSLQLRLDAASTNIQIYHENLSTAKSRISDVDMANETAELTKNNILNQVSVSVLSQANSNANLALKLL